MGTYYYYTPLRSSANQPVNVRVSVPESLDKELYGLIHSNGKLDNERASYLVKNIHIDLVAMAPHSPMPELITSLSVGTALACAYQGEAGAPLVDNVVTLFGAYREQKLNKQVPMLTLEHLALAKIDSDPELIKAYKASPLSSFQKAKEWDRWLNAGKVTLTHTEPEDSYHEKVRHYNKSAADMERRQWVDQNCTIS